MPRFVCCKAGHFSALTPEKTKKFAGKKPFLQLFAA
jgi:hypothetical protein